MVQSRAFTLYDHDQAVDRLVLVPAADMMNHRSTPGTGVRMSIQGNAVVVTAHGGAFEAVRCN